MSKTIEDKAQEFAGINEDKKCNYSFSYNKYDIANAFQNGAEFGYALAESRIKKEYEWKLRWIPISEKMPTEFEKQLLVKNENYNYVDLRFFNHQKQFDLLCKIHNYTHWRPIF